MVRSGLIGVDEVGRGAWAGPVMAGAAQIIDKDRFQEVLPSLLDVGLNDSKKMSSKKRTALFAMLQDLRNQEVLTFSVGAQSNLIIDQCGIREANRRAMWQAIRRLDYLNAQIQIDGRDNYRFRKLDPQNVTYIVRGDSKVHEIMMASIVAKVSRDAYMVRLHSRFSDYGFDQHMGYGTKLHQSCLEKYGACKVHRCSYEPIKKVMNEEFGIKD